MEPPPFPEITEEVLFTIVKSYNLKVNEFKILPQIGLFNKIYQLGEDFILRISRKHPKSFTIAQRECIAVPLARAVGVRTPELLVHDASRKIIPAPFTIYERIHGETLGLLDLEPHDTPDVWREVGHDLAQLHTSVSEADIAKLEYEELPDPRLWPNELATAGYFTTMEADWLLRWFEHLASEALQPIRKCLCHGDVQATNIMVKADTYEYLALIDWGNAYLGDPAYDFGDKPIRTAPYVLQGYREVTPLENDETAEARILWRHLQLALHNLWREPQPDYSWAERPMPFLLDIMRFLLETDDERWKRLIA